MSQLKTESTQDTLVDFYLIENEPKILVEEFSRITKILKAEYKPSNVCNNLSKEEQHQFLKLIQKYEHILDSRTF
jgi:hypothetical protein